MKRLSECELLNLTGGQAEAWTECDVVIAMGNSVTDPENYNWDAWLNLFDEYCL